MVSNLLGMESDDVDYFREKGSGVSRLEICQ